MMSILSDTDLKKCLKPITSRSSKGNRGGMDLRYSTEYDQIREASRSDPNLPQGVWTRDIKSADWKIVEKLCLEILQKKSKDFLVAAWLIESWMHLYALEGVHQGVDLLFCLTKKFWETGYPLLSTTDPEYRAAPYDWINEKLSERLNHVRITAPKDTSISGFSYGAYIDCQSDNKLFLDHSLKKIDLDDYKKKVDASLQKTPTAHFEHQIQTSEAIIQSLKELQSFLDAHLGSNGPSLNRCVVKIQKLIETLRTIVNERRTVISLEEATAPDESADTPLPTDTSNVIDGVIHSRAEAYAIIEKAAAYLEQLDPHSPAPHLIKRAVRWGKLNFTDLIRELVKDGSSLEELKHLLGLTASPSPSNNHSSAGELPK